MIDNIVDVTIITFTICIIGNCLNRIVTPIKRYLNREIQEDGTVITYYYDVKKEQKAFKILKQSCCSCNHKDDVGKNYCTKSCPEYAKYYRNAY